MFRSCMFDESYTPSDTMVLHCPLKQGEKSATHPINEGWSPVNAKRSNAKYVVVTFSRKKNPNAETVLKNVYKIFKEYRENKQPKIKLTRKQ